MRTLYDLAEGIRRCTACPLWEGRTLAIPGDGEGPSKIMFIGDLPGVEEDRLGRPFVGPSGDLFNEMLELVSLNKEKCFLTHACKCHPKRGRKPKLDELKTCKEQWLDLQISIIKPKLIVLMGDLSLKLMFGGGDITKLHGKVIDEKYFITYSPDEALKSDKIKKAMKADFKKLALYSSRAKIL